MYILGITGGIACGKSFVTQLFGAWGAKTESADADARAVVLPGTPTLEAVFAAFPEVRLSDGVLDRAKLAGLIFADAGARVVLEAILHPAIFARMQEAIAAARAAEDAPVFVYEVPLLFEKNRENLFDATVAVVCSSDVQIARLQERERIAGRPELSRAQIEERLGAQLPNAEKARRADFIISTDGTLDDTVRQACSLWKTLTGSEPPGNAV